MGNTIYKNIKEYKNGNKEIFREIINVFNPLINKLSKSVNGEDTRQDLLVHLLEIINKLPEENRFEDDKIIFSYISKALKYEYIKLSKKNDKIKNREVELNLEIEIGYEEFDSEVEVLNLFEVLTEKEEYIMKLIYINYLSISEVADYMGISRQAINQAKNRAISKLKKVYSIVNINDIIKAIQDGVVEGKEYLDKMLEYRAAYGVDHE